jgi:predicted transcriptional regulator
MDKAVTDGVVQVREKWGGCCLAATAASTFGADLFAHSLRPTQSLSQETLADMTGTTRSRVSSFMNKFRSKGLVSYNGKIEVHSSLLDAVLRDKPQMQEDE